MNNDDFKNKVNAILKVQLEDNIGQKASAVPSPYVKRAVPGGVVPQWKANVLSYGSSSDWNYYVSLKISNLEPLGTLMEKITEAQDNMINELGRGVVEKTTESPSDLLIRLLVIKEDVPNAMEMALKTLGGLPVLSGRPTVDFGGILCSQDAVSLALFSETLEECVTYIIDHCSKTPGLELQRVEPASLSQKGLFKLDILGVGMPSEFQKTSQKARFGRFGWNKIEVVNNYTNRVYAKIDVSIHQ